MSPENEVLPSFLEAGLDFGGPNFWRKITIFPVGPGLRFRGCLCWLGGIYLKVCLGLFFRGPALWDTFYPAWDDFYPTDLVG
jgi:hypothetical protein